MINFVICEDSIEFHNTIIEIINNFMINNDFKYDIYSFYDYDDKFYEIVNSDLENKIYILDIECPSEKGDIAAKIIRNFDLRSFIILITAFYEKHKNDILESYIMFLKVINKLKDYKQQLIESISMGLNGIEKTNIINVKSSYVNYKIDVSTILYVYSNNQKTYINTTNKVEKDKISIIQPMKDFIQEVNVDFVQSHKSCYINKSRVSKVDTKHLIVYFDDGQYTNLVSRKYLKDIIS